MIMREVLNPAEKKIGSAQQRSSRELSALLGEIDGSESRDGLRKRKSRSQKSARSSKISTKRSRDVSQSPVDVGSRKLRKRSKSRGASSSLAKHKKSKHKHRRHDREDTRQTNEAVPVSPRVNPIFLWIKQDNTKIVEVLCEDYDKRNRIRLTKTPSGWRAIPRTERLVSAISQCNVTTKSSASIDAELVNNTQPLCTFDSAEPESSETKDDSEGASNDENSNSNAESCVLDDQHLTACSDDLSSSGKSDESDSRSHQSNTQDSELENKSRHGTGLASNEDDLVGAPSLEEAICDNIVDSDSILRNECEVVDSEVAETVDLNVGASSNVLGDSCVSQVSHDCETKNDTQQVEIIDSICTKTSEIDHSFEHAKQLDINLELDRSHAKIPSDECISQKEQDVKKICQMDTHIPETAETDTMKNLDVFDDLVENFVQATDDSNLVKSEKSCLNNDDTENSVQFLSDIKPAELSSVPVKVEKQDAVDICNNFIILNQNRDVVETKCFEPESVSHIEKSESKEVKDLVELDNITECDACIVFDKSPDSCKEALNTLSFSVVQNDVPPNIKVTKVEENQHSHAKTESSACSLKDDIVYTSHAEKTDRSVTDPLQNTPNECKKVNKVDFLENILDLTDSDSDIPLHQKLRLPEGTTISHITGKTKKQPNNVVPVTPRPAHTNSQPNFLETLLSYPKTCHQSSSLSITKTNEEPLDLGKSSKVSLNSPTVTCSTDSKKGTFDTKSLKEKPAKVNDITLKSLLNQNKAHPPEKKPRKYDLKEEELPNVDTATRSKLLELLTCKQSFPDSNPLAQLKDIMSNPDLIVPDPLLVPRARLPALIANPAREIPQLLTRKPEQVSLSYPKPAPDPDLLVVSLAHLQSLLQKSGNEAEDWLKYQQQAQLIQSQMKKDQLPPGLDPASASALNQMLWLPYLNQLEASGANYAGNQELINMLNMIAPSPQNYYQMNPFLVTPPSTPPMSSMDFQQQMEFQKSLGMWHEAIMKSSSNQFIHDFHNNNISKPVNPMESSMNAMAAQYYRSLFESGHPGNMTSARTNPISPNYQKNKPRFPNSEPHPHAHHNSHSHSHSHPYISQSSLKSSSSYHHHRPASTPSNPLNALNRPSSATRRSPHRNPIHETETPKSNSKHLSMGPDWHRQLIGREDIFNPHLSKSPKIKRPDSSADIRQQPTILPNLNIEIPCVDKLPQATAFMSPPLTREAPVDLSEIKKLPTVPKLKVKQHLVDPNAKPKLLNIEDHPDVGSSGHNEEDPHLQLWHPFFGSQGPNTGGPLPHGVTSPQVNSYALDDPNLRTTDHSEAGGWAPVRLLSVPPQN